MQIEWTKPLTESQPPESSNRTARPIAIIFGLLIFWALLIAFGAIVQANSLDIRKPLIVVGTMGAFLVVWLIALLTKRDRGKNKQGAE